MTESSANRRQRLAARLGAEASPAAPVPDKICLPDQSQPASPTPGKRAAGKKGRHLGGRRVDDPRSARLALRVTEAQSAALRDAAQKARMSITAFVCWRCLDEKPTRYAAGPDTALLRQILAQMGKRGANLNQIDRPLTAGNFRDTTDALLKMRRDHAAALVEHRGVCHTIMKVLGVGGKPVRLEREPDIALLRQVLAQIDGQGVRLNQIARRLNSCEFRDVAEALLAVRPDHAAALAERRSVCRSIIQALGI
jgi:hypothetical protein